MFRRLVPLLALALIAGLPAGSALATTPVCTAQTSTLRYKPEYTASCTGQTIVSVELVKTSNGATVGITPTGVGTSDVTVDVNGTLASNIQYRLKLTVDDGSGAALWAADVPDAQGARESEPARQVHHRDPGRRRARHGPPDRQGEHRRGPDQRRLHRRLDPEPLRHGLHRRAQAPPVGARRHRPAGAEHGRARERAQRVLQRQARRRRSPGRRTGSPAAPAGTRRARSARRAAHGRSTGASTTTRTSPPIASPAATWRPGRCRATS